MFFHKILEAQPDPIFGLNEAFQADLRPNKVNLIIGIYKSEKLQADLMTSVRKIKNEVSQYDFLADYLPIDGFSDFLEEIGALAFGEKAWREHKSRIYSAQAIGGTGALQVGSQFLSQEVSKQIAIPAPTWANHRSIFERAGLKVDTYPYYSREMHGIDFEAFCSSLQQMPEKTVLLFHTACHNPSGCDPSLDQWKELSKIARAKKLLPFFDFAYQGLGDGLEKDRQPIEIFLNDGHEMLIAYSCSKNFSLYCQRVGALFVVSENAALKEKVGSQIKKIIRSLYSNPPAYGAHIVTSLLKNTAIREEWMKELDSMRRRIAIIRESLVQRLSSKLNFDFLRHHKGMFSFIDFDKNQVQKLIERFAIYMIDNGRISLTGLNSKNIDYVADSIIAICET